MIDTSKDFVTVDHLKEIQLKRLKNIVEYVYKNVPLYKRKFDEAGVKPEDIETLEDISKLPFTDKEDLRSAYPYDMFAVPMKEIIELHSSSGTTGKPVVVGYTKNDIDLWKEVMGRALSMAGVTKEDIVQNCYGYGLFTGGLGVHYGTQAVGAAIIPISAGNTKKQVQILKDFGASVITCTPSYSLYLDDVAKEMDIDLRDLNLKVGVFGAEMWTDKMREEIENKLGLTALNIYGLTEIIGPGVAQECLSKNGLHIFEDHFYPEIVDSETLKPVKEGEKGELVLTTITKEGIPVIRFRTKDITSLHREQCSCGRTLARMSRITGRSDDMLKIRGVILFPSAIEKALLEVPGVSPHYLIVLSRPHHLDEIEVQVETAQEIISDEIRKIQQLKIDIENRIAKAIGLRVKVTLCEPKTLPRSEGKAKRVIDNRNLV